MIRSGKFEPTEASMGEENDDTENVEKGPCLILEERVFQLVYVTDRDFGNRFIICPKKI